LGNQRRSGLCLGNVGTNIADVEANDVNVGTNIGDVESNNVNVGTNIGDVEPNIAGAKPKKASCWMPFLVFYGL
jgi:hypothetical protein